MKSILTTIAVILSFCVLSAQNPTQELEKALEIAYKEGNLPSFSVSIMNANEMFFQKAYGFANKEQQIPLTNNHSQIIASVSKTFLGVALMKGIELELFDLDTDINELLPFKVKNPRYPNEKISIRHLGSHTSGIVDRISDYQKIYFEKNPLESANSFSKMEKKLISKVNKNEKTALKDFLKEIMTPTGKYYNKKNFSKKKPGTEYKYSNVAGSLAALIIEEKSGMSYEAFVDKYILKPLQIKNSSFYPTEFPAETRTIHYSGKNTIPIPVYTHLMRPIGGLSSSGFDMSLYLQEMIAGYQGNGKLLTKESYKELFTPAFSSGSLPLNHPDDEINQGIFWNFREGNLLGHTGGGLGTSTFLFFDTETGIGKIFMTNCELEADKSMVLSFLKIWSLMNEYETELK